MDGTGVGMAEAAEQDSSDAPPPKRGKGGLLAAILAPVAFGGIGFFLAWSGMIALPLSSGEEAPPIAPLPGDDAAFVPLERLTVTLGPEAGSRFLRVSATLEVVPGAEAEVARLTPRILDVLTTYLQALRDSDLDRPAAMPRMRAHMLRRIRIVAGPDRVRDLLITEFILQ